MSAAMLDVRPASAPEGKGDPHAGIPEIIEERRRDSRGDITTTKYHRGKLLGKGGFAKCFVGTLLPNKTLYALKIVAKTTIAKPRAKQKLHTEIKIHKALYHMHVVHFDRVFEDPINAYIVLELCSNNSMSELMKRRKKLTEFEAKYYLLQLIRALEYLHANCIIHRDLKLGNLFLDSQMRVKVGDFGLATRVNYVDERKKTVCGTPNYIAPEILESKNGHSYEVDIWSTGVILFTVLVGKPPFEGEDVKSTYQRILANSYCFPEVTEPSDQSRSLIRSMLQANPDRRPNLGAIIEHAFFQPLSAIPLTIPSTYLRNAPSPSDIKYMTSTKGGDENAWQPKVTDENDPSAMNVDAEKPRGSNGPEKRPHAIDLIGNSHGAEKRALLDLPTRESRSTRSTLAPVPVQSNSGRKAPIRSVLSLKESTAQPSVSRLIPSTAGSRAQSVRPATAGGTTKYDVYADPRASSNSKKEVHSFRPASSEKGRTGSASKSASMGKSTPPLVPLRDNYVASSNRDIHEIQMDMDNVKLEDKQSSAASNKRKPADHDAWGWNDDDELFVPGGPLKATSSQNVGTPHVMGAIASSKDLGTIEAMYGTLHNRYSLSEDMVTTGPIESAAIKATVWVVRYVDYTSKYGLGFLLNNGSTGVHFNDSTKIVLSPDGTVFQYIERNRRASNHDFTSQTHPIGQYPPELHKKVTLLLHFGNYLIEQDKQDKSNPSFKAGVMTMAEVGKAMNSENKPQHREGDLPFLKKWVRTRHAILFRLSNKTVQVVFSDRSEILLTAEAHSVTFVDKLGARSQHSLHDALVADRPDIAKRLKYTKDMMYRLISLQTK